MVRGVPTYIMKVRFMPTARARAVKIAWIAAIVLVSASAGMFVDWNAPGISRYARDWLMWPEGAADA